MDFATLVLGADTRGLGKGRRDMDDFASGAERTETRTSAAMKRIGAAAGALAAGLATALSFQKFISATVVTEKAQAQLASALRSTGGAAGKSIIQLNAHAVALQKVTNFGDEATNAMQGLLLTFTNIKGTQFDQATEAVLDLATAMGTDLNSAALQVGKALNDPVLGMTALARSGIQFTEAQKDAVKAMVETNNIVGAQTIILKELERQFGGSAEAARATLGGALAALGNAWGDLFEVTGPSADRLRLAIEGLVATVSAPGFVAAVQAIGAAFFTAAEVAARALVILVDNIDFLLIGLGVLGATLIPAAITALYGLVTALGAAALAGTALGFALNAIPFVALVTAITGIYRGFSESEIAAQNYATSLGALAGEQERLNIATDTFYQNMTSQNLAAMKLQAERARDAVKMALETAHAELEAASFYTNLFGASLYETDRMAAVRAEIERLNGDLMESEARVSAADHAVSNMEITIGNAADMAARLAGAAGRISFADASNSAANLAAQLGVSLGLARALAGAGAAKGGGGTVIFDPRDPKFDAAAAGLARTAITMQKLRDESEAAAVKLKAFVPDAIKAGAAAGAAGGKVKELAAEMTAAEQAAKAYADAMQGIVVSGIGSAVDWMVDGFKGGFKGLLDIAKNTLKQIIAFYLKNRVTAYLGLAGGGVGGGGIAGAAAAVPGGAGGAGGILSQIGLLGKAFMGGMGSVWTGLTTGGISGAFGAVKTALGGLGGGLTGLATAAGAIAGPLLAVAAIFSFFKKKTTLLDSGLRVTIDGMQALVETFRIVETRRFWGLSKKVRTSFDAAPEELSDPIGKAVGKIQDNILDMADLLGIGSTAFAAFAHQITFSTKGMTEEQVMAELQNQLTGLGDAFAGLAPGLQSLQKDGEGAMAALERLSTSMTAVNFVGDTLGHTFRAVGLAGAAVASDLVDAFGGLDAMNSATSRYFAAFYTDAERLAVTTRQTAAALAEIGVAMPQTRAQFRAMIEALDVTTESGRKAYAALIGLAGAFDEILPAVANLTAALAGMVGGVTTEIDSMIATTNQAQQANAAAARNWYQTSRTLRDVINKMRGTAGALTSATQAQAFNEAQYQMTLAAAMAGDMDAAQSVARSADMLLGSAQGTARTAVDLARIEARVLSDLSLLAGVSDIEGARHDVVAGLLGQQVDLLGEVRDYLNSGAALDATQIDALNAQLGSLEGAIAAAEMINYAFLQERMNVTVNLLATADLPDDVRRLIANAQTGVRGTIDFVVRSDLTPDQKFLALTGASEHIKTLKYVLDDAQWPDEVQALALTAGGMYRRTIRYIAQNTMPADLTALAIEDASTLLKSIRFAAQALPADVRAIVFNDIAALQKRINFIQGSDLPEAQKRLALADAAAFKRTLNMVAGNVVTGAVRDLALANPTEFNRSLNILAGTMPDNEVRRLALSTAGSFSRVIDLRTGSTVSATTAGLALSAVTAFSRTISLIARNTLTANEMRAALVGSSELSRVVNVALASGADQRAIQLAIGNAASYSVAVTAALSPSVSAATRKIVFDGAGQYVAMIEAALSLDGVQRRILLAQQGVYAVNVTGILATNMPDSTRRLLLNANTQGVRAVTIAAVFAGTLTPEQREALRASGANILRTISAVVNPAGISGNGLLFLRQLSDGQLVERRINGTVTVAAMSFGQWRMLTLDSGAIARDINGRVTIAAMNAGQWRMLTLDSEVITRTINGIVTTNLSPQQAALLAAINGGADGRLTLGGSFLFDPTTGFKVWYESTTVATITAPLGVLRSALDALSVAIRAETQSRAAAANLAERVGAANTAAARFGTDAQGRVLATASGVDFIARAAGVATAGRDVAAVGADVAALSQNDGITGFNIVPNVRDYLFSQFRAAVVPVDAADYMAIYSDLHGDRLYSNDPAGHYRDYGRAEILAGRRTFNPQAFDWSAIGIDIPGFAAGGAFGGGLRIVGENGPELEATGPSRIYSAPQTRRMMDGDRGASVVAAVDQLRREVASMREEQRQLGLAEVGHVKKSADTLRKWDIDGLPAVRV